MTYDAEMALQADAAHAFPACSNCGLQLTARAPSDNRCPACRHPLADPDAVHLLHLHREAERYAMLALQAQMRRNTGIAEAHAAGTSAQRISILLGLTSSRIHAIIASVSKSHS